ncbi:MAG: hypothetical protein AVDCRST_MAG88-2148, partial [uncultured Thermomicrobiales bacterium]
GRVRRASRDRDGGERGGGTGHRPRTGERGRSSRPPRAARGALARRGRGDRGGGWADAAAPRRSDRRGGGRRGNRARRRRTGPDRYPGRERRHEPERRGRRLCAGRLEPGPRHQPHRGIPPGARGPAAPQGKARGVPRPGNRRLVGRRTARLCRARRLLRLEIRPDGLHAGTGGGGQGGRHPLRHGPARERSHRLRGTIGGDEASERRPVSPAGGRRRVHPAPAQATAPRLGAGATPLAVRL